MAISLSPSTVDFGSTATGNKVQQELTVSNSANSATDVTVSIQGGTASIFSVSPSGSLTVAANGSATLTLFFEPTEEKSYSAQLKVAAGGPGKDKTAALSGTGTAPSGWQQEAGSYLLMKVPDYGDGTFETRNGPREQVTMTSYLRLGTFDWSQESPTAKELLKLLPQTGIGGDPVRDDSGQGYGGHYPDFDYDSVNAFEDLPPVKLITEGKDCKKTGNREVFFIDDVRVRAQDCTGLSKDDDPGHGLTMAQRQLESARLYSRGGWRDHSDGNRISTTYGDKVEVVRGNYRLLVLGRQDDPGEGMGSEASGSSTLEYSPGMMAGAAVYVEWIPDYKMAGDAQGVWLMTNTTQNCYIYDRNAGNFREEVWGDVHESYTGQENPPSGAAGTEAGRFATDSSPLPTGHEPPFRVPGLNYDLPQSAGSRLAPNFKYDNAGLVRSNPHIIEKTWARRIDSWQGSEACPIPTISEKTWADEMYSTTGSAAKRVTTQSEETWGVNKTEVTNLSGSSGSSEVITGTKAESTVAGAILANEAAATKIEMTEIASFFVEGTAAAVHVELEASNHVEIEGGIGHVEISACPLHFALDISAKLDITLGASYEIKLGKHGEFKSADDRAKLKEAKAALTISESYLKSDHVCLEQKLSALSAAITALKVNLGS